MAQKDDQKIHYMKNKRHNSGSTHFFVEINRFLVKGIDCGKTDFFFQIYGKKKTHTVLVLYEIADFHIKVKQQQFHIYYRDSEISEKHIIIFIHTFACHK